jgi:uncharacterized membrane protein (DUF485 family)
MTSHTSELIAKIDANPKYHAFKRQRNVLGWTLTVLMLLAYYGYIGLIAFDKAFLAKPLGTGVTTVGIPLAIGVMVFTIVITAIYVHRANTVYDRLTGEIIEEAQQ